MTMKIKGILYVALACLAWGSACLFLDALTGQSFDSIAIAQVRCTVAALVLLIYALIKNKGLVKLNLKQLSAVAVEGISFFFMAATYFYAMEKTTASTASMLISCAPVVVSIVAIAFFREKLNARKIFAIILSLVGALLVIGITSGFKFSLIGVLSGIAGAMFYASYIVCTKTAITLGVHTDINISYSFCFAALGSLTLSNPVSVAQKIAGSDMYTIALLVGIGVVTGALASLLYTNGMKLLPASTAAPIGILETIFTSLFSILFLGENPDLGTIIGMVFVVLAIFVISTEKAPSDS